MNSLISNELLQERSGGGAPPWPPQNIWKKIVDIQSMSHPNQIWKILGNRYARTRHSQTHNKHTDILTIISQNKKRKKKGF